MRALKFRHWHKATNNYTYFRLSKGVSLNFNIEPELEQYTGLKAKNGKEIYEGDIVRYTTEYYGKKREHLRVVEWEEWDSDDFGEPHNIGYRNLSGYEEVIGNIHENPELLEEE